MTPAERNALRAALNASTDTARILPLSLLNELDATERWADQLRMHTDHDTDPLCGALWTDHRCPRQPQSREAVNQ